MLNESSTKGKTLFWATVTEVLLRFADIYTFLAGLSGIPSAQTEMVLQYLNQEAWVTRNRYEKF